MSDEEIIENLIDQAINGEHSNFTLIGSLDAFKEAKVLRRSLKIICNEFKKLVDDIYSDYLKDIKLTPTQPSRNLIDYKQFKSYLKYYEDELAIMNSMIKEYRTYLGSNINFIKVFLLNHERTQEEMVDYRTIPL